MGQFVKGPPATRVLGSCRHLLGYGKQTNNKKVKSALPTVIKCKSSVNSFSSSKKIERHKQHQVNILLCLKKESETSFFGNSMKRP